MAQLIKIFKQAMPLSFGIYGGYDDSKVGLLRRSLYIFSRYSEKRREWGRARHARSSHVVRVWRSSLASRLLLLAWKRRKNNVCPAGYKNLYLCTVNRGDWLWKPNHSKWKQRFYGYFCLVVRLNRTFKNLNDLVLLVSQSDVVILKFFWCSVLCHGKEI